MTNPTSLFGRRLATTNGVTYTSTSTFDSVSFGQSTGANVNNTGSGNVELFNATGTLKLSDY